MKVAIIGAGGMAGSHLKAYELIKEYEIIAVVDTVAENALAVSEKTGAQVFGNIDEMLEKIKPDMCDICAPSYLHSEFSIKCMKAGIHVFCEKPMAHSVEDADLMIKTAKENNVSLMVGQLLRYWPEYAYLKEIIETKPYGPLRHLQLARQYGVHPAGSWYMDPKRCKMVCYEMHIHDTDYVNYVFGKPLFIDSAGVEEPSIHMSYMNTRYIYEDPVVIIAEGGWSDSCLPYAGGFKATFNQAVLVYADGALTLYPNNGRAENIKLPMQDELTSEIIGVRKELLEFLDCIKLGVESATVPLQSSRDTIYLVGRELESAALRKPVSIQ